MATLIPQIRDGLAHAFGDEAAQSDLRRDQEALAGEISKRIEALRAEARTAGLDLNQTPEGMQIVRVGGDEAPDWMSLPEEERRRIETAGREIGQKLATDGVTEDELKRALAPKLSMLKKSLRENSYWLGSVMAQSQEQPYRLSWARERQQDYANVSLEEINALAKKYLGSNNAYRFEIIPKQ